MEIETYVGFFFELILFLCVVWNKCGKFNWGKLKHIVSGLIVLWCAGKSLIDLWAAQVPSLQLNVILMGKAYNDSICTITIILYFKRAYHSSFYKFWKFYLNSAKYAFNPKDVKLHTKVSSSNNSCSPSERDIKERIRRLSQVFANKVYLFTIKLCYC